MSVSTATDGAAHQSPSPPTRIEPTAQPCRTTLDELLRDLSDTRLRYETLRAAGAVTAERSDLRTRLHVLRARSARCRWNRA